MVRVAAVAVAVISVAVGVAVAVAAVVAVAAEVAVAGGEEEGGLLIGGFVHLIAPLLGSSSLWRFFLRVT